MGSCVCCGNYVPDEQSTCSMCYGDPCHGSDGYYLQWLEEQYLQELQARDEEMYQQNLEDESKAIVEWQLHHGD